MTLTARTLMSEASLALTGWPCCPVKHKDSYSMSTSDKFILRQNKATSGFYLTRQNKVTESPTNYQTPIPEHMNDCCFLTYYNFILILGGLSVDI